MTGAPRSGRRVVIIAVQQHLGAQIEHRLHFDLRCRLRHHDHGWNRAALCRERYALRMIAGGGADDAALRNGLREVGYLVVRAAQLEGKNRLQVLALEEDLRADAA